MLRNRELTPLHLVSISYWPFFGAFGAFTFVFGVVMKMHGFSGGSFLYKFGLFLVVLTMLNWWLDVIREATFEGQHTKAVQIGLRLGVILFIVSEIMFFFGFFWAFFHSSFNPVCFIGGVWTPNFITPLNPFGIPLLNTILLLTSGFSITWSHNGILLGSKNESTISLLITIILAFVFMFIQAFEYFTCSFNISDGVYGSTFFMATGFHGFHVFVGTVFLIVCLIRLYCNHFTKNHHFGFEAAAYYWHFVDVVWLFLFLTIYWWGY